MAHSGFRKSYNTICDAANIHKLTGQHEERYCQQLKAI